LCRRRRRGYRKRTGDCLRARPSVGKTSADDRIGRREGELSFEKLLAVPTAKEEIVGAKTSIEESTKAGGRGFWS
jgi:hypothetical protein